MYTKMGEGKSAFNILKSKPTGKKPPGRRSRRWEHNIKIELK